MNKVPTFAERLKAGGLHLIFSAVLLAIALYLVFVLWYPAPLHKAAGVVRMYFLMLGVDLLLGPVLTFIVYKRDMPRMAFDLVVILVLQLAFFSYGLSTVAQGRPVWLAFVVDDFELVASVGIDRRQQDDFTEEYRESLWENPRWVAALYSNDPVLRDRQREDEIFAGISLAQRPETYAPLSRVSDRLLSRAQELAELEKHNDAEVVAEVLSGWTEASGWLPLKSNEVDMVVLLDDSAGVVAVVDLRPW